MEFKIKILGIIPARGGSKGIPNKNIIDFCGKPLIAWSIETAQKLLKRGILSRCIVSTDSKKIAETSLKYGADIPFLRPSNLSNDQSKSIDFIKHALSQIDQKKAGSSYNAIMILQPTNPKRKYLEISDVVINFMKSKSNSLISCYEEHYVNDLVMYKKKNKTNLLPLNSYHNKEHEDNSMEKFNRNGYFIRNENKLSIKK